MKKESQTGYFQTGAGEILNGADVTRQYLFCMFTACTSLSAGMLRYSAFSPDLGKPSLVFIQFVFTIDPVVAQLLTLILSKHRFDPQKLSRSPKKWMCVSNEQCIVHNSEQCDVGCSVRFRNIHDHLHFNTTCAQCNGH